jgi:predicted helicase
VGIASWKRCNYFANYIGNYRRSLYRPFCKKWLFFDRMLNERVYLTPELFPTEETEQQNMAICCTSHTQMPFTCIVTNCLPNEAVGGRNGQCFPLYVFSPDGSQKSDNITDWALSLFRNEYRDSDISRRDIFNYVYAILHHPLYRSRFAQNLQKEIPHVPFASDFYLCANIGSRLVQAHLGFESAERFNLKWM